MAADAAVTGIAGMRSAIGANEHCGAGERSKRSMIMDKSSQRTLPPSTSMPRWSLAAATLVCNGGARSSAASTQQKCAATSMLMESGVVELIERRGPQVGTQRRGEAEARQLGKQLPIAAHRASPIAWKG
jgi:hypothetical protein